MAKPVTEIHIAFPAADLIADVVPDLDSQVSRAAKAGKRANSE
jgi:hypothetical protein